MNRTKTKIPVYIFLGLLVVAALYYALVFTPLSRKLDEVSRQKAAVSARLAEYDNLISSRDKLLEKITELEEQKTSFPERSSPVRGYNFAEDILEAAKVSGANVTSVQIDSPEVYSRSADMSIYSVRAIIQVQEVDFSSYISLLDYFESSENGFFYVRILELSDLEQLFDVTTELVLYYPDASPAEAAPSPAQTTAP